MIFDNAKLMSCSFLHQQHLKCASFVYSATAMGGVMKTSGKNQMWEWRDWKTEC